MCVYERESTVTLLQEEAAEEEIGKGVPPSCFLRTVSVHMRMNGTRKKRKRDGERERESRSDGVEFDSFGGKRKQSLTVCRLCGPTQKGRKGEREEVTRI